MKLTKQTKKFIFELLSRELEAEYINDNMNPQEVEYLQDLIKASREFARELGFPYDYAIEEDIKKVK